MSTSCCLEDIEPKVVFKWFSEISKIPRGSGNEKAISDFLVDFAKKRNLEVFQDKCLNVIIKKSGTAGFENSQTVIIQGHMDMVCEKTVDSVHDFLKDPIKPIIRGNMVYADKTTLGGDDGIAVAYALSILDSNDIPHPPLEVLITTEEETGMGGAMGLSGEFLTGKRLLNIDSEEEGTFLVSCAGGANINISFDLEKENAKGSQVKINISGLLGGHSGMEIIKQRANAIKLLARILNYVNLSYPLQIVEISGGSKHNAIPKEAAAIISVDNAEKVIPHILKFAECLKAEYREADSGIKIEAEKSPSSKEQMFTEVCSSSILDFLMMIPDGVQYMSTEIPGLVRASLNDAIIEEKNGKLKFTISVRSSVKSSLDEIAGKLEICAKRTNGIFEKKSEYPAWEYAPNSAVRDIAVKTYKEIYGKEPIITAIHAGLECGLLKKTLPEIDAISFGPNLYDVHTPNEHMDIESVDRVWKFLIKYLGNLK